MQLLALGHLHLDAVALQRRIFVAQTSVTSRRTATNDLRHIFETFITPTILTTHNIKKEITFITIITFSHRFLFGKLSSGHKVFLKANTEK